MTAEFPGISRAKSVVNAGPPSVARVRLPPEDLYCQDMNAISIVAPPKGRRGQRTRLGLEQGTKRLISRVMSLSQGRKCSASDAYLAWLMGASVPSVSRWIAEAKEYGILTVKKVGGRRLLSINGSKLQALKEAYTKALHERKRKYDIADQSDDESHQVDGRDDITLIITNHQTDEPPYQSDRQLNNGVMNRSEKEDDNGVLADARTPASSFLLRISELRIKETAKQEELAASQDSMDAIEARLGLDGVARFGDAAWCTADRRLQSVADELEAIQDAIYSLEVESAQEDERLRMEAERLKVEAELDAWRHDPDHGIVEHPDMVLDAFQAACSRRFPGVTLSFPSREGQVEQAAAILRMLKEKDRLDEMLIRSWIMWHAANCLNERSPDYHITIRHLPENWGRFNRQYDVSEWSQARIRDRVLFLRRETAPVIGTMGQL